MNSSSESNNEEFEHPVGMPLQIIKINKNLDLGKPMLSLNQEALNIVLSTCQDPIQQRPYPLCIICVVGAVRTGKSFLLNYIKAYLESIDSDSRTDWFKTIAEVSGFEWSHDYEPNTKGIWLWSKAFLVSGEDEDDVAVLLMDTEGFDDECSDNDIASAILGLSLLTASVTIFNVSSELSSQPFNLLEEYSKYGTECRKSYTEEKIFQKLSFLVRDYTKHGILSRRSSIDASGKTMFQRKIPQKFHFLRLETLFHQAECFFLPNIGEKARMETFVGKPGDMDKDFQSKLKAYVTNLCLSTNLLKLKILENEITSQEYFHFLEAYVNTFNKICWKSKDISTVLYSATHDAAMHLKCKKGMKYYEDFFHQQLQQSPSGYINQDVIHSLNIQAKEKAKLAFQEFDLLESDNKTSHEMFDNQQERFFESFKTSNQQMRQAYIDKHFKKSLEAFRSGMLNTFPFTSDTRIPIELVFYDKNHMLEQLGQLEEHVVNSFTMQLPTENLETRKALETKLREDLKGIFEPHVQKTAENQHRATAKVKQIISDFRKKYYNGIREVVTKAPGMELNMLEVLHKKEIDQIQQAFKEYLFPGTDTLKETTWCKLSNEIQEIFQSECTKISDTAKTFHQSIDYESNQYRQYLEQQVKEMEECDENFIHDFHQKESQALIQKIKLASPFPENSFQAKTTFDKLELLLKQSYDDVVRHGMFKEKQALTKLKKLMLESLEQYKAEMTESFGDYKVHFDSEEFQVLHNHCKENTIASFLHNITKLDEIPYAFKTDKKLELDEKIDEASDHYKIANNNSRVLVISKANETFTNIEDKLEQVLLRAGQSAENQEKLQEVFEASKQTALETLTVKVQTKNKQLVELYKAKILKRAQKLYQDAEESLMNRLKSQNIQLQQALFVAQMHYQNEMNSSFENNRNHYFTDKELEELNLAVRLRSIKRAKNEISQQLPVDQLEELEKRIESLFEQWKEKNEINIRSFADKEPAVGIDLGTTYCCMAIYHQGKNKIIRNPNGQKTTPSYVTLNADGTTKCVGHVSKDQAFLYPEATIFDAKRIIGKSMRDKFLHDDIKYFPFSVVEVEGAPKVKVEDITLSPEEISAKLLEQLREDANNFVSTPVTKAVITVPAHFSDRQRQATINAGKAAGFEVLGIINEPSAAAFAYRNEYVYTDKPKNVLVYDLGGGTFDVAVLQMSQNSIEILSVNGDGHLGGKDFDKCMMKHCAQKFQEKYGIDLFEELNSEGRSISSDVKTRLGRLQSSCEKAKQQLTTAPSATISIDHFYDDKDLILEVPRGTFESINDHLFQRTIAILNEALACANIKKEDIDEIVLVGGSTRIPKLQQMLRSHFNGKALNSKINPDEAVAYGAAIQAALLSAKPDQQVFDFGQISEVTSTSIGIEVANSTYDVIIRKNTKIPVTKNRLYKTSKNDQQRVVVRVYEGEEPIASQNSVLGDVILDGIPPGRAGQQQIDVSITVNRNGILEVEAACRGMGSSKKISVNFKRTQILHEEKIRQLPDFQD